MSPSISAETALASHTVRINTRDTALLQQLSPNPGLITDSKGILGDIDWVETAYIHLIYG